MRLQGALRTLVLGLAGLIAVAWPAMPANAGPPGSLDQAFGDNGKVDSDFGDDLSEHGAAFVRQPDGKLIVAGTQAGAGPNAFAVARYLANGHFDQGFGDHGHTAIHVGGAGPNEGDAVALTPGGKIVLAGQSDLGEFAVIRLRADGTPDTSFNQTGDREFGFDPGTVDLALAVAVQGDGKIVVAGSSAAGGIQRMAVARVRKNGTLDSTFSGDGLVLTTFGGSTDQRAEGVIVLDDGRIAAVGEAELGANEHDLAVAVYKPNGLLDQAFSGDGRATVDFAGNEFGYKVAEQPDGRLVVSGETDFGANDCDWALARFKPGGALDPTFSGDGKVTTAFGTGCDIASGLLLMQNGKIVGVGSKGTPGAFTPAVVRYKANGARDMSFSGDGKVVTSFGEGSGEFWGAAETPAGKIVAGGRTLHSTAEQGNFAMARYLG